MEKKIELECDYCGVPITEKDHKCPNCGADCTVKIKNYKAQQAMKGPVRMVVAFVAVVIFIIIITMFINFSNHSISGVDDESKKVEVGYDEVATSKKYTITLDSYELYEYTSDNFPESYNTPAGYQKVAFHFIYQNLTDDIQHLSISEVRLTADDYTVDGSSLKTGVFEKAVTGKAQYPTLLGNDVPASSKLQGYVGFLVPKDKKILKFTFENTTITMDNPVYETE